MGIWCRKDRDSEMEGLWRMGCVGLGVVVMGVRDGGMMDAGWWGERYGEGIR